MSEEVDQPKPIDASKGFQSVKDMELGNSLRSTTKTAQPLLQDYCDVEELLLSQLLRNQNLDPSWSKVLIPICT